MVKKNQKSKKKTPCNTTQVDSTDNQASTSTISQVQQHNQATFSDTEDDQSEPDFTSSFSDDTMMWMRRIIRVQAADVLKNELQSGEVIGKDKLQVEINNLKSLIHSTTESFEKKVADLETTVSVLKDDNLKKDKLIRRMEFEDQKNKKQIQELLSAVDEVEQDKLRCNIQIVGLPESRKEEEDTKKVIKLAHDKIGIKLKKQDLSEVYRLGKKTEGKSRDIVVKFVEKKTRDAFYQNRKKTAPHKEVTKNIYINDQLTRYRKGLFFQARKLLKARKIYAAWTQNGNILIRKSEGEQLRQIAKYADLRDLQDETNDSSLMSPVASQSDSIHDSVLSHISDYSY